MNPSRYIHLRVDPDLTLEESQEMSGNKAAPSTPPDQTSLLGEVLLSSGPHADLSPEQQVFAPFIGSWNLEVTWYDDDIVIRREKGEWHFFWVLEGRAVQDIWIVPPRRDRAIAKNLYEYGTSIRFYDSELGLWRSTWIGPMRHSVHTFVVERACAALILTTVMEDRSEMRWVFSRIRTDSFSWRNERKQHNEWTVTQTFEARRVTASPHTDSAVRR